MVESIFLATLISLDEELCIIKDVIGKHSNFEDLIFRFFLNKQ